MLYNIIWWAKTIFICAILLFVVGVIHGSRKQ